MPKVPRQPFEITLTKEESQTLATDLARALDEALAARSITDQDLTYFHTLYEQGRTRTSRNTPWPDAADLTSYLGTQYVDVMRSHIVKTIMTEPVYTVEGYGQSEAKAPFVEEFHQWQIEAEGFQQVLSRAIHLALIEPFGVLEVYQDTIRRLVRSTMRAALQLGPDGAAVVDEQLNPVLQMTDGQYVPVMDEQTPSAEVEVDTFETVCRGPRHRAIPYRDFVVLPAHAQDKSDIWGYAKRFWRRMDQLRERVNDKHYDAEAVKALGTDDERPSGTTLAGEPIGMATKDGTEAVEKELWELLILRNLDGKGLRWYVVTLHKDKREILRVQYDDIGRPRYFLLVPFPRANSIEGYSYVGHKLITVIEEHTAWRNMLADRASVQLQAPIKRQQGALWDPESEPIGPKAVIPVRRMDEVEPMQFPDATGPAIERIRDCERTGERLAGINDAAAGVTSDEQRTLGEIKLITEQSLGRVTEAVKNIQEAIEEIGQVRHLFWKRALRDSSGMEAPPSVLQGLEFRGVDVTNAVPDGRFTAMMLEGAFRFKPRGSVENADRNRQRYDFAQSLQAISAIMQANPLVASILQTPQAAKALIEQWVRLFNVPDKQAFLGSEAMAAMQGAMQQQQLMQMMAAGGGPSPAGGGSAPPGIVPMIGAMGAIQGAQMPMMGMPT